MENGFVLLGSTGSIGEQALDVARQRGIRVDALSANRNYKRIEEQAREFHPSYCALADENAAKELKIALADTDIKVFGGQNAILDMIGESSAKTVLNSIIGEAGLFSTLRTLEVGKSLALANKESLVVAGEIVMNLAKENNTTVYPVDSEHCAIHQCLRSGKPQEVKRLIITASGGPFFGKKKEELMEVTAAEALAHPTWSMGAKITIDSATLMNKGLEIIEAAHLFGIHGDRIKPVVHRQSIIHSMVEYNDNSVIAQMSVPDMRHCIQYALDKGARSEPVISQLDLCSIGKLTFEEPDLDTFPLLSCAVMALSAGGALPAVMNAANEVAVDAFLKGKITFFDISDIVMRVTEELHDRSTKKSLSDILDADMSARELARIYSGT